MRRKKKQANEAGVRKYKEGNNRLRASNLEKESTLSTLNGNGNTLNDKQVERTVEKRSYKINVPKPNEKPI